MDPCWDLKRWQKMVFTVGSPISKLQDINHKGLKSRTINVKLFHKFPVDTFQ